MTQEMEAGKEVQTSNRGFGEVVRAAREAQGMSVSELAHRMHVSASRVQALEDESPSGLPEPVYVRAYLRHAASILGLDAEPLVADYVARFDGAPVQVQEVKTTPQFHEVDFEEHPIKRGKIACFVRLVILLCVGVWFVYSGQAVQWMASDESEAAKVDGHVAEATVGKNETNATTVEKLDPSAVEPAPVLPPDVPAVIEAPKNTNLNEAQATSTTPVAGERPAVEKTPTQEVEQSAVEPRVFETQLRTSASCWVQIISPEGKNLLAKEMKAGDIVNLALPVGTKVTVGNTPALLITIDGKPFDLSHLNKRGVARFVLQ